MAAGFAGGTAGDPAADALDHFFGRCRCKLLKHHPTGGSAFREVAACLLTLMVTPPIARYSILFSLILI